MTQRDVLAHTRLMLFIHSPEQGGELSQAGVRMLEKAIASLVADTEGE